MAYKKPAQEAANAGTYGKVDVGTTSTEIVAANKRRLSLVIQNQGTTALYLGFDASVTTSSFAVALPGGTANRDGQGSSWQTSGQDVHESAVFGIRASGTTGASYSEINDQTS